MIRELIDPEWYDVAKAVCYLLGAGCCALSHWLGYRYGRDVGRSEARTTATREWLDRFRRYAAGCDRLDAFSEAARLAEKCGVAAHAEPCPRCGAPVIVQDDSDSDGDSNAQ